ncbi:MAG TPA: ABC transporter permease subunit [Desulfitobacteriaceae bacterium]|nr:ABC transporter permease subunit [Desulfitobacteriaceae bacterium]
MLTIIKITLLEIVRRRILLVTILLAIAFLAVFGIGVHYGYRETGFPDQLKTLIPAQFLILGLFFGSFIISFLAIMAAVGAISTEIENGTMHAIVPRPIRRSEIVLGKFLGYGLALAIFAAVFYIAVLLLINFQTGVWVPIRVKAIALYALQPLILLTITMFGTTFLPTLANGIAIFIIYALGILGGMMEQIGYLLNSKIIIKVGIISSLIMPADTVYRKIVYLLTSVADINFSTYLLGPFGSGSEPSVWMLVYIFMYICLFLFLAIKIFSKRNI